MPPVLALFKFGRGEHIEDFARGTLYMNALQYFADLEALQDVARGDEFEGVGRLIQADGAVLSMQIDGEFRRVATLSDAMKWRPTGGIQAYVFCMYALRPGTNMIDTRNLAFGDTFAVLTDGDEFLRRVTVAATASGYELSYHLVEYIDEHTYTGPMGIFRKRAGFSHQSELRIALTPGTDQPYCLRIGDLSDITITGPLAGLNQQLRIATDDTATPTPKQPE